MTSHPEWMPDSRQVGYWLIGLSVMMYSDMTHFSQGSVEESHEDSPWNTVCLALSGEVFCLGTFIPSVLLLTVSLCRHA